MIKEKTAYSEALRYLSNAKQTLLKAGIKDNSYVDVKYVRTASGTAYNAALIAVDEYLRLREGAKYTKPKSIDEYRSRIVKHNKKMLSLLNDVYDQLHLAGYYHGTPSLNTIKLGLANTKSLIEFIK